MIDPFWPTYARTVIAISLFLKVYWTDDCSGLSAKSQLLYGTAFLLRCATYLIEYWFETRLVETAIIEIICILVTISNALLMMYPLNKIYEAKNDTVRIDLLIVACLGYAIVINYDLGVLEVIWQFSIYLESLAIIPQCQFTKNTGRIRTFIVIYFISMAAFDAFNTTYWIEHNHFCYYYNVKLVTLAVQILSYSYFFFWILPCLIFCKKSEQDKTNDVEILVVDHGEKQSPSFLKGAPAHVYIANDNKADHVEAEEIVVKY